MTEPARTLGEVARETGLPRRLVGMAARYFHDPRLLAFSADLAKAAPTFHAAFQAQVAQTPKHRFAALAIAWWGASVEERCHFTMALQRLSRAKQQVLRSGEVTGQRTARPIPSHATGAPTPSTHATDAGVASGSRVLPRLATYAGGGSARVR